MPLTGHVEKDASLESDRAQLLLLQAIYNCRNRTVTAYVLGGVLLYIVCCNAMEVLKLPPIRCLPEFIIERYLHVNVPNANSYSKLSSR